MVKSRSVFHALAIVVIVVVSFMVVGYLSPFGSATSPDSLGYLDIAENIKNGNGFVATDFSLDKIGTNAFRHQRAWPPLYPVLLSVFVDSSRDVTTVSQVSKILFSLTTVFVYLTIYLLADYWLALVASLLFCFVIPMVTVYAYAWSETLFLPVLVIAVWSSVKYLKLGLEKSSVLYRGVIYFLLLLALFILAYVRYVGIAFVALLPMLYFLGDRDNLDFWFLLVSIPIYIVVVGFWLVGNYIVSDSITGAARCLSDKSVIDNLNDVFQAFSALLPSSLLVWIVAVVLALSFVFVLKVIGKKVAGVNSGIHQLRLKSVRLLSGLCVVYFLSIVTLRTYCKFDVLDVRLLSPLFILLYVLIVVVPGVLDVKSKTGSFVAALSCCLIILFSFEGYAQWILTAGNWKKNQPPGLPLNKNHQYNDFTSQKKVGEVFSKITDANGVIVVDKPLIWRFITGTKCVQKPKNIDLNVFKLINTLPYRSVLIINKNEKNKFFRVLARGAKFSFVDLGSIIVIRLPVKLESVKNG